MKTFFNVLFLSCGGLNLLLFGLFVFIGSNLGWDTYIASLTVAFLVSGVLLTRAPFSRKNFDSVIVSSIRIGIILLLFSLAWNTEPADMTSRAIRRISVFTAISLIAVTPLRKRRLFRNLPPPYHP